MLKQINKHNIKVKETTMKPDTIVKQIQGATLEATFPLAGKFSYIIDEPVEDGGNGKGPCPVELLYAALASCKAEVTQAYLEKIQVPADKIEIAVEADTADLAQGPLKIKVEAKIHAELSDEQKKRLEAAVSRGCTVAKILERVNEIETGFIYG